MVYTVRNEYVSADIDSIGAEIISIKSKGKEYLCRNRREGRSVNVFPFCGSPFRGKFLYEGEFFPCETDGFIKRCAFNLIEQTKERLILCFSSTSETKKIYPFDFEISITYTLEENTLHTAYRLINRSEKTMIFGIGAKLYFEVKDENEPPFVAFSKPVPAECLFLNREGFATHKTENCALSEGTSLSIKDTDDCIIRSKHRKINISHGAEDNVVIYSNDLPYLGIRKVHTESEYALGLSLCTSLPSVDGSVDNIREKKDMRKLTPGDKYEIAYSVEFK